MIKYLIQPCGSLTLCPLQYFQMNSPEMAMVNVGSSVEANVHRSSTADIQPPLSASLQPPDLHPWALVPADHRLCPEVGQAVIRLCVRNLTRSREGREVPLRMFFRHVIKLLVFFRVFAPSREPVTG